MIEYDADTRRRRLEPQHLRRCVERLISRQRKNKEKKRRNEQKHNKKPLHQALKKAMPILSFCSFMSRPPRKCARSRPWSCSFDDTATGTTLSPACSRRRRRRRKVRDAPKRIFRDTYEEYSCFNPFSPPCALLKQFVA